MDEGANDDDRRDHETEDHMDPSRALSVWNVVYVSALAATVIATVFVNLYSRRVAAESDVRIAEAVAVAATANERAAALEVEAAAAREQQAAAEKELLELQQRLAWRVLTPGQQVRLRTDLSRFAGTRVTILKLGDPEAGPLADALIGILDAAGWLLTVNFAGSIAPPVYGIRCEYPASNEAAVALTALLRSASLSVSETVGAGGFDITVGLKPPA